MDATTVVLGGITVSVLSAAATKYIVSNGKMTETHCSERQKSCQDLFANNLKTIEDKIDNLTKIVNGKLLGL